MKSPPGKTIVDEFYVHFSALEHVENEATKLRIQQAIAAMVASVEEAPNVAKVNLRSGRVSLLAYPEFFESAFPTLAAAWIFQPGPVSTASFRSYRDTINPPILHRKELLVASSHPERAVWAALTSTAERLGLFDEPSTIGFRLNWNRLIESKGYRLVGDQFVPLGNELSTDLSLPYASLDGPVQRHLTALSRTSFSAPVQMLVRYELLHAGISFFDYGCGRGGDISGLVAEGIDAQGWDPHFLPDAPLAQADIVNLGFVINVIEDPAERVEALTRAFRLARTALSVGVMLYGGDIPGRPYLDGYRTSRNTFQKYFSQGEFKDYVEQVLHRDAFVVGPGVAFVFASSEAEQRFSASRYRRRNVAARLLATGSPKPIWPKSARPIESKELRRPRMSRTAQRLATVRPLLDQLWATMLDLGRAPEAEEVANLSEIDSQLGSLPTALRFVYRHYNQSLLSIAAETRTNDLRLLLATQQFAQRPAYRQLEPRLQRDIKAFFGNYRLAEAAGMQLLLDAAEPAKVLTACQLAATQGLGWLQGDRSLQLHVAMVERLPAVLRAYVACGLILWDALSEVQLVKIHISSGKLTLMELDEFDDNPLPRLSRRIKVNIRKLDCDVFQYGSAQYPKPVLYRKSRYLHEDYPGFVNQLAFDEALERTGLLGDSEFGPSAEQLTLSLEICRLAIADYRLVPSTTIPDLDASCGTNFTYRSFIECGETQRRLGLPNLPLNPKTYNALHALAVTILDPVIEYFGPIRLTYGFASATLTRQIAGRIAPRLDQHAACEQGGSGALICRRGGAACDFIVDDEDMKEVTHWIVKHLPFDRLYFYGSERPIHISFSATPVQQAFQLAMSSSGRLVPRPLAGG
ncbi:MAG TPA: peptidase m15a [Candidatus Accumulibacter sp.]|nr:peptidase m15a [Accumulibacter sp.]HRF10557.1 DNA phosphorothioation-associated putative methyltransferase [Candidatus Accumulibacter phosphatis]